MILIFHSLYIIVNYLLEVRRKRSILNEYLKNKNCYENEVKFYSTVMKDLESNLKFDPPVYRQRYQLIQQILLHERWRGKLKKLVDFGCAEFGLFKFLKGLYGLQEVVAVDINEDILCDNIFKIRPLSIDYLNKRSEPLTLHVFAGSIADPDCRLRNTDVVIGIEIIEHLYPDALEALPFNIFAFIQPELAIFTTPNADFNILFPDFNGFRHWDHKFEWSREQFESWATNITLRFPQYQVVFDGVAPGPEGTDNLGYCTQAAIFIRNNNNISSNIDMCVKMFDYKETQMCNCELKSSHGICTYYSYSQQEISYEIDDYSHLQQTSNFKLIDMIEYPYDIDNRTETEKIMDETMYKIHTLGRMFGRFFNEDTNRSEIPLVELISNNDGNFITIMELRKLLESSGNKIEKCVVSELEDPVLCVIYEPIMDENTNSNTPSTGCGSPDVNHIHTNFWQEQTSDWESSDDKVNAVEWKSETSDNANNYTFVKELISAIVDNVPNNSSYLNNVAYNSHDKINSCTNISNKTINDTQNYNVITTTVVDSDVSKMNNKYLEVKSVNGKLINGVSNKLNFIPKANMSKRVHSKEAIPGTSNIKKRKKIKKSESNDSVLDVVKTISECIIVNSLNKTVDEQNETDEDQSNEMLESIIVVNENSVHQNVYKFVEDICDKATNENREDIKNEYSEVKVVETTSQNTEEESDQTNNEIPTVAATTIELNQNHLENEIAYASREALFDPNSQIDLLDDFDMESSVVEHEAIEAVDINAISQLPNIIVIGVNVRDEDNNVLLPANADPFPNWLLQLLGAEVPEDNNDQHDEPHFYCQGDGVGVHPSIIEVDIEEDQSTSESSSNNTNSNDDAEAEPTISEPEVLSLPEDNNESQLQNESSEEHSAAEVDGITITDTITKPGTSSNASDSVDEYFDTMETSSSHDNESELNNVNTSAKQ